MGFYITRPINGISLNGVEYVRDENDNPIIFENMGKAKEFLAKHGYNETNIENEGIDFEEVNPVTPKPVTESFHFTVNEETLRKLKKEYPAGSNIVLLEMDDIQAPPIGTVGTVKGIDSMGDILVSWHDHGSLNVVYGADIVKKIKLGLFTQANPAHNAMLILAKKLSKANIPYELELIKDGWLISYPVSRNEEDCMLCFVRHSGYDLNDDEVYMFYPTEKECMSDLHVGNVSVEEAFFKIIDFLKDSQSYEKSIKRTKSPKAQFVYVCYEENYNDLLIDNDVIQNLCVKDGFDKAYDFLCKCRNLGIQAHFVVDENQVNDTKEFIRDRVSKDGVYALTMFLSKQDNDKESYAIIIEKKNIE